jgi:hypothetical protein
MKKIICLILVLALVMTMSVSASAINNNYSLLSSLSDEECVAFLENNGVTIPEIYDDESEWLPFIRQVIQKVEENPDAEFLFGYTVPLQFAYEIKRVVNEYYGTRNVACAAAWPVSALLDNTVHGIWSNEYLNYNCYAYAIGYSSAANPGQLK